MLLEHIEGGTDSVTRQAAWEIPELLGQGMHESTLGEIRHVGFFLHARSKAAGQESLDYRDHD